MISGEDVSQDPVGNSHKTGGHMVVTGGTAMTDVAKAVTDSHEIVGCENANTHLVEAAQKSSEQAPDYSMLREEGGAVWLHSQIATGEKAWQWWQWRQWPAGPSAKCQWPAEEPSVRCQWPAGQLKTDVG